MLYKGVSQVTACCRLWMDRCKVLEASKPLNLCSWPSRPESIYQSAGLFFWFVAGSRCSSFPEDPYW